MRLRDYQQRTIDMLYQWFIDNKDGHPCVVMPTGSGKSHVIAALCKDAVQSWPETRVLMLTHVKELIEQNAEKMRQHWPAAPLGIYSASLRSRVLDEPITFAGIQSVRAKAKQIGYVDLVIIDECHLISHKDEGGYRSLIADLTAINPAIRVIGLTATPYRLGHGLITDKPALFSSLIEPVSIEELIANGYLCSLRSKLPKEVLDVSGVHKRGGEYIESDLQNAVDTDAINSAVVKEVVRLAEGRRSWLIFCTGVRHAENVAIVLHGLGIAAKCVTGDTPMAERDRIVSEFKTGRLQAVTNANVLTTGFDAPCIDLIAFLRPTMSASLYVQMAGRGMRILEGKKDCLVLDFACLIQTHGPITHVTPSDKKSEEKGPAPVKVCESCGELVHISVMVCPGCGSPFPAADPPKLELSNEDIMGIEGSDMAVSSWKWRKHISKASGNEMLAVTYYGLLSDQPVTEYLPILNQGYAGQKAQRLLFSCSQSAGVNLRDLPSPDLWMAADRMNSGRPPSSIEYKKDGKFYRVINRKWS